MSSSTRPAAGMACLAFFILGSYAVARPATESLFLEVWGSEALPMVWVAVAIAVVAVVSVYNRFAAAVEPMKLFAWTVGLVIAAQVAVMGLRAAAPRPGTFLLYVWKDVYIVVCLEIAWSYANAVFTLGRARWLYGLFCAAGSIGGMVCNFGVGRLAAEWGTQNTLWLVPPLLLVALAGGSAVAPPIGLKEAGVKASLAEQLQMLRDSRYLLRMAALVATIQVCITLIDFGFNSAVQATYADTDARTAAIGRVYGSIDVVSLVLQLGAGPILRVAGVPAVLVGIPAILATVVGGYLLAPVFAAMAAAKVAGKALDYSLFKTAKEMLYIPLSYTEKTQGKGVIDILTYRVAKGGAAGLLAGLVAAGLGEWGVGLALVGCLLWAWITVGIVRRWRASTAGSPS